MEKRVLGRPYLLAVNHSALEACRVTQLPFFLMRNGGSSRSKVVLSVRPYGAKNNRYFARRQHVGRSVAFLSETPLMVETEKLWLPHL
jgi:hypothetical protein